MFNTEEVDVEDVNAVAGLVPVWVPVWVPVLVPVPVLFSLFRFPAENGLVDGVAGVLFDFCPSTDTFSESEKKQKVYY